MEQSEKKLPDGFTYIRTKFTARNCNICYGYVEKGSEIAWNPRTHVAMHKECFLNPDEFRGRYMGGKGKSRSARKQIFH